MDGDKLCLKCGKGLLDFETSYTGLNGRCTTCFLQWKRNEIFNKKIKNT